MLGQIFGDPPPSDLPEVEAIGKQLNTIQDTLYAMEAMISTDFGQIEQQLQAIPASGGAPIFPDSAGALINTTLSLPMPFYSAIQFLNTRLVRRYVFDQSVSDGTYTLYDENNSYPTVSGNNQLTDYFQDSQYLNYNLRVGTGQPSDFMDFGTYVDPQGTFVIASAYAQESSASQRGAA